METVLKQHSLEKSEKKIFNCDLIKNPKTYDVDTLKKNINHLSKMVILSTQIVDVEFCILHILNVDIDSGDEDSYICESDVVNYQPHITFEELDAATKKIKSNNYKLNTDNKS